MHLLRGAAGLIAAASAIALLGTAGPASLALLAVSVLAWRGCPTCWAVGLVDTLAVDRSRRSHCTAQDGCRLGGASAGAQIHG